MKLCYAVLAALPALVPFLVSPAFGRGLSGRVPERPGWQLEPVAGRAPAWLMALWGESPYAEIRAAGFPLPPTRAEVERLPAVRRLQEQSALKAVWLERLIRAREERNRVSRDNLSHCALMAARQGAPAVFVELLRRQAEGALSFRERHLLESAQLSLLSAYAVDARELRFFVEGTSLAPEALREVAAWLPLAGLFNIPASAEDMPVSSRALGSDYIEVLAVYHDLAAAWKEVVDRETADAAAGALLPALARYGTAMRSLLLASPELRSAATAPYAPYAGPVEAAYTRERSRMLEQNWFGSARLQALDYLFR